MDLSIIILIDTENGILGWKMKDGKSEINRDGDYDLIIESCKYKVLDFPYSVELGDYLMKLMCSVENLIRIWTAFDYSALHYSSI